MFLCIAVLGLVAAVDNAVYTSPAYACSIKEFTCGDGACVTWESRCDGVQHCADNSDEEGCWKDSNKFDLYDIVLHRNKRQSTCGKGDFHCRDGTCVSFDKKCDGVIDCPDGSDETHALCRNTRCPSNLFRCTYGACVDGNAACNQKEDCADKSDELLPKCRNEVQNVRGRFTCKNGDTISSFDHCDGVANCGDGSDETIESCAGIRCQTHLFQCAYGACVDSGANCNNKVQCVDGSDEADDLCNRTTTTTTSRPHTSFPSSTSCVLPDYPKHGSYEVVGIPVARPGMSYPSLHLTVTCDLGYGVEGSNFTFCHEGSGWSRTLPVCKKLCKLIPHPSVVYKCKVEGENRLEGERDCLAYEPNNTRVIPRCNPNYHHPGAIGNMRCIDGNNWDTTIICQPGTSNVVTNVTIKFTDKFTIYVSGTNYSISIDDAGIKIQAQQNVTQLYPITFPSPALSKPIPKFPIVAPSNVSPIKPSSEAPIAPTSPNIVKPSKPILATRVPDHDTIYFPNGYASIPHDFHTPVVAVTPVENMYEYYDELGQSSWRSGS